MLKGKNDHIIYIQFDINKSRPQDITFFTSPLDTINSANDEYMEYFALADIAGSLNRAAGIFKWFITENGEFICSYDETLSPKSYTSEVFMIVARLQAALSIWDSVKAKRQSI